MSRKNKRITDSAAGGPAGIVSTHGYDIRELGPCVAVGDRAIQQAIKNGRLKASKIGGKWIILGKNVLKWIEGK